jgi:hypothetical protein
MVAGMQAVPVVAWISVGVRLHRIAFSCCKFAWPRGLRRSGGVWSGGERQQYGPQHGYQIRCVRSIGIKVQPPVASLLRAPV